MRTKTITTLFAVAALAATLTACGEAAESSAEPTSTATEDAGWSAEDEAQYQAEYNRVNEHLLDQYGITESAELCDNLHAAEAAPESDDLETLVAGLADDAGTDFDTNGHIADSGAYSALVDWCDSAS